MRNRGQQAAPHQPPEFPDETAEEIEREIEAEVEGVIPARAGNPEPVPNPWLRIEDAPKDRILEGRFSEDEDVGRPIRWRHSRHRVGHTWVNGGVWHAAETAGAVQLHPTEWREWRPVDIRFEELGQAPVAA